MKKILALLILAAMVFCFAACRKNTDSGSSSKKEKISVVTTIFPVYDWTRAILGDDPENAELTMLLDDGTDLHSYQPSADDIKKISDCDVFVYIGGESDEWVDDAIREADNKDMKVINLINYEKIVKGRGSSGRHGSGR